MHSWFLGHKLDKNLKNKIKTSLWHVQDVFFFFFKNHQNMLFIKGCPNVCIQVYTHMHLYTCTCTGNNAYLHTWPAVMLHVHYTVDSNSAV